MLLNPLFSALPKPLNPRQEKGAVVVMPNQPQNKPVDLPPKWQPLTNKHQLLPLTVAVQAEGLSIVLVQKALLAWEESTNRQVQFTLLTNPSPEASQSANILILWAEELLQQAGHQTAYNTGKAWLHVKAVNNQPLIVGSTIELAKTPIIDAYINTQQQTNRLYTTILHELGHALGLKHAQQPTSVMHPLGWQNTQLTPEDVGLFFQLYGNA
jgi:predicted Zn-dependent protease